jgi:hypothetical protein
LAYRIIDAGAAGGIIVSPLGIQEGAAKIAASENIINVQLDANSTATDFVMTFLNKVMVGLSGRLGLSGVLSTKVTKTCQTCGSQFMAMENERICSDCQAKSASERT